VPRVVSLIVLVAIILLIGLKFFQVMVLFMVPLFLAAVLVVIFKPLHLWVCSKTGKRRQLAAALTTAAIALIVLLPTLGLTIYAVSEGTVLVSSLGTETLPGEVKTEQEPPALILPSGEQGHRNAKASLADFVSDIVKQLNETLEHFHLPAVIREAEALQMVLKSLREMAAPLALGSIRLLGSIVVTLAIMVLATYYFLADGPAMLATLMRLSPLDDAYERELLDKFADISRTVVLATLLSAVAQGVLAGVGFYFAGIEHVIFLTTLTIFLAMIPFVGSAAVWVPACAWLYLQDHRTTAAIVLALYCVGVVSMVDNLIKPYILHGQANLHPLLALLSVIGGVQALGPIGILVGPMLVAFLQALMNMFNKEIEKLAKEEHAKLGKA
jgi:predicted PurR-regulated permease PerM